MGGMSNNYHRPSWDEYFLKICEIVGSRGTCDRGRSGCVVVKNKQILTTGYVGSPTGLPHCDEVGHEMSTYSYDSGEKPSQHCIRTAHAELNAIAQAAKVGIALDGSTLYMNMLPCYTCAKTIINAGIVRVVCEKDYHAGKRTKEVFAEAGVKLEILTNETETYDRM